MKFTFYSFLFCVLFSLNLKAQNGTNGTSGSQDQNGSKINWSIDPFEHALFVENKGQFDTVDAGGKILFEAKLGSINAFFTAKGILYRHIETEKLDFSEGKDPDQNGAPKRFFYYLSAQWDGANPNTSIIADEEQTYYYTYPNGTHNTYTANVFKKITYKDLYPGIDVIYTFKNGTSDLEYTIVVHPGGDLSKVHLKYENTNGMQVDASGNVTVKNDIGILKESAAVSYYLENHQPVTVTAQTNNPDESFIASSLDATKTLMIDPAIVWTTNPNFTSSSGNDYAYDLDYDNLGNVYVYGGGPYPFQLVKLNSAGAIQWTFNATTMSSSTNFYGDFATDKKSLENYIVEGWNAGGGARVQKISPTGGLIATDPGNSGFNEMWRIESTVCPQSFVIFGNGTCCPDQAAMLDTTMTTIVPANILGATVTAGYHDMALTAADPMGGSAWTATTQSLLYTAVFNNYLVKVPLPALVPNNYAVADGYTFAEIGSIFYSATTTFNAMNGLACGLNWVYAYDGQTLKKFNKASGALITTAAVSGTPYTWGGLDVDLCDNIYVGNNNVIDIYNSTALTRTGTLPALSGVIYDLAVAAYTKQLVYACGQNFVSEISLGPPPVSPITIQKGGSTCAPCSGVAKATLMLCGNPDSTNVTYRWSDGETTRTAKTLCTGVDTVTITIGCDIIFKDTVTIKTTGGALTVTTTETNATCTTLGTATATVTGGSAPYTYLWNPSAQTTATATGLSAGTYTITVTDKNGCQGTATATITQPTVVTVTATNTNEKCNGGSTATATATATGGTAPYTYAWTPTGGTNATATGLSAGTYTITVKDKNGCTATASVSITQPPPITATISASANILCNGGTTGSATVTAGGGTAPYTYLWNPGGNTNANATGLSATSYTVTVTDNNGCTATATVTLTQPPLLTATMGVPTNVLCNGGNNGSAMVTAAGGTPAYTYAWAPAGGTNANGTGLSAGNYTVTVTDHNGCTATASVTITQPPLLTATMGIPTNVLCNGGSTGSATVTAAGGTPAYTYAWTPAGGTNANATGLSAGTYTVTITDKNGCTATSTVTITQPAPITLTTTITPATCGNNNGSATVTIIGGTPVYTYLWSPSASTTATATGLSAGTYTITVTDKNGCTQTSTAIVTSPSNVTATITASTNILCNGGSTGLAIVTAAGGTAPYTYLWNPSGQTTATATGLSALTYTVTVTDNTGCSTTATVTLTQPPLLTATIGASTNVLCNGGNNGSATVKAGGGSPNYAYTWAPNGGNGATGTGMTAGSYTVTVTDANGCTATAPVTITQPPLLTATIGATTNVLCNGGSTGSSTVTAAGGSPVYTYSWTPSGGTSTNATGLSAGTYTITITDINGCTSTASVIITQPTAITLTTATTQSTCGNNNGTATVTAIGGTPAYTYLWTPSASTTATATGLSVGTYTIIVTDNNGCTQTSTAIVTSPSNVTATITASTNILCNGGTTGSATVTSAGGTAPYTYLWTPSGQTNTTATGLSAGTYTVTVTDNTGCNVVATVTLTEPPLLTAIMGAPTNVLCNGGNNGNVMVTAGGGTPGYTYVWAPSGGNTATGTGLSAGTYTVTVTDNNGCTATASVTITEPTLLTATMGVPTNVSCNAGSDGSVTVTAGGGTPVYTYAWTPSGGTNANATGLSANSYTITITDNNGCTATATVTITQPTAITLTTTTTQSTCGNNNGTATVTALGGTPAYTYLWTPSANTNSTATGLSVGTYTILVTDNNGCTQTTTAIVSSPSSVSASITASTNILCNGGATGSATVTATGGTAPYTYLWNPSGQTNATATGLSAGAYTVTVTDNNGCSVVANVTLTEPPLLTATMGIPINVLCNGGTNGSATITAGGGTPNYTYAWAPTGGNGATGTGLSAGIYTVTVTDVNGCTATAPVTITQPTALTALISATVNITCSGLSDGSLAVTAAGGTAPYTYAWTPSGGTAAIASALSAGTYTINIIDNNGCTASAVGSITQPTAISVTLASTNVPCFGTSNGSIIASPSGGTAPYTYAWIPSGGTTATASNLSAGTYTVTLTDANGCSTTASATLTEPTPLVVSASGPQLVCSGNKATLNATVSGGTPTYTYAWSSGGTSSTTFVNPVNTTTYTVVITDANGCTATATVTVGTNPPLNVIITGATSFCPGGSTTLSATPAGGDGIYTFLWLPGGSTTQSITVAPTSTTTYTVELTDDCGSNMATAQATVTINPLPVSTFQANPVSGCAPLCVQFRDMSTISSGNISNWEWTFGNNDTSSVRNPIYCYPDTGTFSVSLTTTSNNGCSSTLKILNMVTVYSKPNASFTYAPQPVDMLNPTVQFTYNGNSKYPLAYWDWTFGDGKDSTSGLMNPIHTYSDTGTFCASLVVMDSHGCVDTATNCIVVGPDFTFYIPDAFSPNDDGINDVFLPKGNYIKDFEMYIFDRWGMKLFYSGSLSDGWNGKVGNHSTVCQEDTYVYLINVTDTRGNKHSYTGKVNLVK